MARPLLSVVLIAKNEEASIGRLLASLRVLEPIGYEVCLYDTGSTDRTVEIATAAGARVERGEWTGDYGAARNKALAMARGTWALSLDADEVLEVDAGALAAELRRRSASNPVQYAAPVHLYGGQYDGGVIEWQSLRLLRVGHSYWYRPIHEFPAPLHPGRSTKGDVLPADVLRIRNHGYESEHRAVTSLHRKHAVLETLLAQQLADGITGEHLALTYFDLGRSSIGIKEFDDAEMYFRLGLDVPNAGDLHVGLQQYLVGFLSDRERYDDALELLTDIEEHPRLGAYTAWQRGRVLSRLGDSSRAADILLSLTEVRDYQGIVVPRSHVLREALKASADAGRRDDATVAALSLVAGLGEQVGVTPLLTLWGTRPPATLAHLITNALGPGHTAAEVADLLRTDPRGAAAADVLDPAGASIRASEPPETDAAPTSGQNLPVHA